MINYDTLRMYQDAEELQKYCWHDYHRMGEEFGMWYYQYPGKGRVWEVKEYVGIFKNRTEDYLSRLTKVVWLPNGVHLENMIPHRNLLELDEKFSDFKHMFYEEHWFDDDRACLEGRGDDPFDCFDSYDTLWLGFVMMDRFRKRWYETNWVATDIYPDYFKMGQLAARLYNYPDPDKLHYISGLRGYVYK